MTHAKALILGCSGPVLTSAEREFFQREQPWGFILFRRNIETREQVRRLVDDLRTSVGRNAPILIDQEGGTVRRLRPPLVADYPAARDIAALYGRDPALSVEAAWACGRLMAADLVAFGINVDCAPVLDMPPDENAGFMASRANGTTAGQVIAVAGAVAAGLQAGGVLPVLKHMPGHGRGLADSHKELPRVSAGLETLRQTDFLPFVALRDTLMAMTCHVIFKAIDNTHPASTSPRVIEEIIRGEIGFDGLLISDDISMNALSGDIAARAAAIVASGTDIVLHCNGDMNEMQAVAACVGPLEGKALMRAGRVTQTDLPVDNSDLVALRKRFETILGMDAS